MSSGKNTPPSPWGGRLLPTTTAHQARLQLFQPTRHPKHLTREIQTPWGVAKVTGKLGQVHALLLEAIFFHSLKKRESEDGRLQVLIDPYSLRRTLSTAEGGVYSLDGVKALLRDLRAAAIEINIPRLGESGLVLGGLLDEVAPSPATVSNPMNGEVRHLWKITLSKLLTQMLRADLPLHYNPALLASFKTGVGAAVARWVLTHRDAPVGGWKIDTILTAVGADTSGAKGRQRRHEIRQDTAALAAVGIIIQNNRISKEGVVPTPGGVVPTPGALSGRQGALSGRQGL
ncbi:MAG: ABC transporter ATPase [Gammaproteobacteria bacterium]|nr:ABC transporter ATPase [Gammaproteobacteria bacterium]